ncbi:hypothetical protein [Sphingobacterium thermophilum]|uniref:Thiamine diphosphokinase n=1 Tax=Sphingobacterium thermophilum TaxID=768534 RepID=A0ABP8R8X3_9SPHI
MSSHHVVRENQEPALVVEEVQALSEEYLGQLLEWSPTLITTPQQIDYFLMQDIKIDVLYGVSTDQYQEDIKVILPEKDFLTDSIQYLIAHGHKAVNILTKTISEHILSFADAINIVLFCEGIRYVVIREKYEKWKTKGDRMFVEPSQIKSFNGLRYVEGNIFQVEQDGFVALEMNTDQYIIVGEEV